MVDTQEMSNLFWLYKLVFTVSFIITTCTSVMTSNRISLKLNEPIWNKTKEGLWAFFAIFYKQLLAKKLSKGQKIESRFKIVINIG